MSYNIEYILYVEIMIFSEIEYESEINNFELIVSLMRYLKSNLRGLFVTRF